MTRYASPAAGYFASVNQAKKGIESMKHYKNLGKRVLSLFVAFIMCVSLVPTTATAYYENHKQGCDYDEHAQHNYTEWDITKATCTASGSKKSRCSNQNSGKGHTGDIVPGTVAPIIYRCSATTTQTIPAGHNLVRKSAGTPATCLENGTKAYWECVRDDEHIGCGKRFADAAGTEEITDITIPATGHKADTSLDYASDATKHWKTCINKNADGTLCGAEVPGTRVPHDIRDYRQSLTNPDTHDYYCVTCGKVISTANHEAESWQRNSQEHWKVCKDCGVTFAKAEHLYSENLMTECECGAVRTDIPTPGCNHPKFNYVDNGDGTHKVVCATEDCGYEEEAQQHVWVGDKCAFCEAEKPCNHLQYGMVATPNSDGITHTWYCANCKTMLEGFEKADHKMSVKDNGATHTATCSECGFTATEEHTYGDWSAETGSCEKGYIKTRTCTLCGHTHTFNRPGVHERNYEVESIDGETHGEHCLHCGEPMKVAKHTFVNDVCKVCGAAKPTTPPVEPECEHPGTEKTWADNEDGTHTVTCSCGNYKEIEKHTYDLDDNTKCKCGAMKPTTPVEPEVCKHPNVKEAIPEVPATCETDGMKAHYYCDDCQKYLTGTATHLTEVTEDSLVLKATGHKWIAVPEEEATCTKEGMQSHNKCENCGQLTKGTSYTPVTEGSLKIAKKPHTPGEAVVTKEASCKEEGTKETRCTVCNTVISTESIAKLPHTEVVDAAVPATCTTAGKTEGKHCSVCGEVLAAQTEIAKLPHTYGAWTGMEGSVNHTRVCTVCGDEETSAHVWDAGEVTTSATCEGAEVTTYTCTVCGLKHTEATGGALGHNAVAYATVPATCTTTGYTGGTYCSRCNAVITSRITIPALGHNYGAWTVTRAATCAAAGEETRTCARNSGHTETRTVAATGNHAWNAGVITTYPTYYSTGLRTYTCATCAATRTETIPQLTYTYDPGYTDPDPDPDPDYQPPVSSNRQPTTPIPDDNTPLGNTPNTPTVTIEDEDTPLANRPLPFIDVASGDWFRPYVSFVYGKGMMTGMSDTLFGPNVSTTRGMIVTIIYRMENASATGVSPFTDVERDEYYADPISWASDNGVVLGYSETLFGPKDNITREQMAAILYRYCVSKGIDVANYGDLSRFPDGDKVSDYAVEAMRWAVDRGLIAGMDDGRLDPTGTATRAQVATILNRFCEMIGA